MSCWVSEPREHQHALFPFFDNGDDIFRQVHDTTLDHKRDRLDAPALNRFLAHDWRDMSESKIILPQRPENKESVLKIADGTQVK